MVRPRKISKTLSANDTGMNGTHQAGILVPKDKEILSFFPTLDATVKNPRAKISLSDSSGRAWSFSFIHYNNKFFDGTRDEYRLTGMTGFMREIGARVGDKLVFSRDSAENYHVELSREREAPVVEVSDEGKRHVKITASSTWKVVAI